MGCCQAPAEVVVPGRFVFEDVPATDRCPDEVYLSEVERCDVFVGLLGQSYGMEDVDGLSPTEREFDRATALGKHRMIFLMWRRSPIATSRCRPWSPKPRQD